MNTYYVRFIQTEVLSTWVKVEARDGGEADEMAMRWISEEEPPSEYWDQLTYCCVVDEIRSLEELGGNEPILIADLKHASSGSNTIVQQT